MRFNENARLDPSQVEDRRGRLGGTGGMVAGGGGLTLIGLLVALFLGINPMEMTTVQAPATSDYSADAEGATRSCQTGADANQREDCRIVAYVNSIQDYWAGEFAARNARYSPARTQLFSGATQAGCGYATAAAGPFYCPPDGKVYLDLTFFNDLQTRFGARGGPFAQAYVLAHEYGHHVQNLGGMLEGSGGASAQGAQGKSTRVELQADCLAGVWAGNAVSTGYLTAVTDADIAEGLDAAAAVGDDRIQRQTQGRVSPETWTHGSSQQRQQWFTTGLRARNLDACDTSRGRV